MNKLSRRTFLTTSGVAAVLFTPALRAAAVEPEGGRPALKPPYRFFNEAEAGFIESACERLIPADESGPGVQGPRAAAYLDAQLHGAWGCGTRAHRSGPWQPGSPTPSGSPPLVPAELFRRALRGILGGFAARGLNFRTLPADAQLAYLRLLEAGSVRLDGVACGTFFELLLKLTLEAFLSDAAHGARREILPWRVTGYAGALAHPRVRDAAYCGFGFAPRMSHAVADPD